MPELPEVETVTNALRPHLVGRCITTVETHTAQLRTPVVVHQHPEICGATITAVRRRAKYILVELDRRLVILVHLGMTGSCRIVTAAAPSVDHEHIIVYLDDGMTWRYRDPRRFGMFELHPIGKEEVIPECLAAFGPEPLAAEFTAEYLRDVCRQRQKPIKNLVMDNACVVGVGNIYASEALWWARISPRKMSGRLALSQCGVLAQSIVKVLSEAIESGSTVPLDFAGVEKGDGLFYYGSQDEEEDYEERLMVYNWEGEPCERCETPIRKIVQAARSTYFCPKCQRD